MEKKLFVLVGSRRRNGNTVKFVQRIEKSLCPHHFHIEYAFPQDFQLKAVQGNEEMFMNLDYGADESLKKLQSKVLQADLLIIASPVYVHSMSADMKRFIEGCASWVHTLRLQGKPVVVLSSCGSNGYKTVIEPLGEVMTYMGGNVIATANVTQIPNRLLDKKWCEEVCGTIADRIVRSISSPPSSNQFLEKVFNASKLNIMGQRELEMKTNKSLGELNYWRETGMIDFNSFQGFLDYNNRKRVTDST